MLKCLGSSLSPLWENLGLPASNSWDAHQLRELRFPALCCMMCFMPSGSHASAQWPPVTAGRPQAAADPRSAIQAVARWSVYPQCGSAPAPSETQGRWGCTDHQGGVRGMEKKVSNRRGVSWEHKIKISLRGWQVASAGIAKKGDSEKRLMKGSIVWIRVHILSKCLRRHFKRENFGFNTIHYLLLSIRYYGGKGWTRDNYYTWLPWWLRQ